MYSTRKRRIIFLLTFWSEKKLTKLTKVKVRFTDDSEREIKLKNVYALILGKTGFHFLLWDNGVESTQDIKQFLSIKQKKRSK